MKLYRIITECNFGHDLFKLTAVGYGNCEMLQYADPVTRVQLRNFPIKVSKRNFTQTISEMLATELKYTGTVLHVTLYCVIPGAICNKVCHT